MNQKQQEEPIPTISMLNRAFDKLAISNHPDEEEQQMEEMEGQIQQVLVSGAALTVREYVKKRYPRGAIGKGLSREIVASIGRKWNELVGE